MKTKTRKSIKIYSSAYHSPQRYISSNLVKFLFLIPVDLRSTLIRYMLLTLLAESPSSTILFRSSIGTVPKHRGTPRGKSDSGEGQS